jgi:hypothetical protein
MADDEHKTEELKIVQADREAAEREAAASAVDEDEARYLRQKLEEREQSERRLDG